MSNRHGRGTRITRLCPTEIGNLAVLIDISLSNGRSDIIELMQLRSIFRNRASMYGGISLYELSPEYITWVSTLANEQRAKLTARILKLEGRLMQVPPQEKLEIRQELPGLHSYLSMYNGIIGKIDFCQKQQGYGSDGNA